MRIEGKKSRYEMMNRYVNVEALLKAIKSLRNDEEALLLKYFRNERREKLCVISDIIPSKMTGTEMIGILGGLHGKPTDDGQPLTDKEYETIRFCQWLLQLVYAQDLVALDVLLSAAAGVKIHGREIAAIVIEGDVLGLKSVSYQGRNIISVILIKEPSEESHMLYLDIRDLEEYEEGITRARIEMEALKTAVYLSRTYFNEPVTKYEDVATEKCEPDIPSGITLTTTGITLSYARETTPGVRPAEDDFITILECGGNSK